jgi:hypothetical protein
MMTQFLYILSCSFRLGVAAVGRNCARKLHKLVRRHARAVRTGSGSAWAMTIPGYRSSGAALGCAWLPQHRCAYPSPIVVTYALAVAEPCAWAGARRVARRNSFEVQTAWSVCTAVRTVLCKDAQQMHVSVGSGGDENVKFM